MEEVKVVKKEKKPFFNKTQWILVIIFAIFGLIGMILHFLGFDDVEKGHAAEVTTLSSMTDYLLVSKTDPYIMIGTPDPDGELDVGILKVDQYGFYNFFKVPSSVVVDPFPSVMVAWNQLYNLLFGSSVQSDVNDGTTVLNYRMSAGSLNQFTGHYRTNTISHNDFAIVKGCLASVQGGHAWLSTSNFVEQSPVPRLNGFVNVYYFFTYENGSREYYAVSTGGGLHLHRASADTGSSRIVYSDGMVLYHYINGSWTEPYATNQTSLDSIGLPYIFNFENAAGHIFYDTDCVAAIWMMSFSDQVVSPTPSPSPSISPIPEPVESNYIIAKFKPLGSYNNALPYHYYAIEFVGNVGLVDIEQPLQDNSGLQWAMSEFNVGLYWIRSVFIYNSSDDRFYFFTGGEITSYHVYDIGDYLISTDLDFIKEHYSDLGTSYLNNSTYGWQQGYNSNYNISVFSVWGTSFSRYPLSIEYVKVPNEYITIEDDIGSFFSNSSYIFSEQNIMGYAYKWCNDVNYVPPTPTLDPNAPTPTPAPTEPPHVIIQFPSTTPTPTPTPVIVFSPNFPSGIPLGSDSMDSVLNDGGSLLSGNAVTVLARALSFFPSVLIKLWWFWIFLLVVVATIRAFVHFTG